MKKILCILSIALFATASFAQDSKKQNTTTQTQTKSSHECYMMKDGALMHHVGDKSEAVKSPVKLINGTTISQKGEMRTSEGRISQLENGQCVSLMGGVGECEKMHSATK